MPKVTNAFTAFSAKGNREDLANAIYNIDPTDRPFMSAIGRRSASNVQFDWQTEALPAVDTGNKQVEGFELSRSASTPTVRVSNVCQISTRDATVSGTQNSANAAGKRREMAHQVALMGKALLRDCEAILLSQQARNNGVDDTTPRATRGFEHFLTSNVSYGLTGANPVSETATLSDGTQRAFDETMLLNSMQTAWTNGAEVSMLLMGGFNKRRFSGFAGRTGTNVDVGKSEVVQTVDIYRSDFGTVKALLSRWSRSRTVLGVDPRYAKMASYRELDTHDIAKIGDAETKMILVEYGLEVSNEKAHFKVADLTTS